MPVFYALIARGKTVLTEYTARSGNFPTVTRVLLSKIDPMSPDGKMSYIYDEYVFHYQITDGITYLCLADEKQKRRIPFLFLADIQERFVAAYRDRAKTAIAFAMNDFARTMQDRMEFFNDNPAADNFGRVRDQLAEVKEVMVENIEKVLARGEKIELLVDKTDALNQSAKRFQKQSRALKNVMWWKNIKMWIVVGLIVAILIFAIVTFSCGGFSYSKCK